MFYLFDVSLILEIGLVGGAPLSNADSSVSDVAFCLLAFHLAGSESTLARSFPRIQLWLLYALAEMSRRWVAVIDSEDQEENNLTKIFRFREHSQNYFLELVELSEQQSYPKLATHISHPMMLDFCFWISRSKCFVVDVALFVI